MLTETNLAQIFRNRAATYEDATRWRQRRNQRWLSATWRENQAIVNSLMGGLDALGVKRGDVVGILSGTRWEWMAADWAILSLGAVTTALYPAHPASIFEFILNDSDATVLFVEDGKQYEKLHAIRDRIRHVRKLILFDDADDVGDDPWVLSFEQLRALSTHAPEEVDAFAATRAASIRPDDIASIIYTSGTTGQPKGTIHTHGSLVAQITGGTTMLSTIRPGMVDLLWLPLVHVYGRLEHLAGYERGLETVVEPSLLRLAQDLRDVKPDLLFGAPQIYERAYRAIVSKAEAGSPATRLIFRWSQRVGGQVARRREAHQSIPPALRLQYAAADRLVFRRVRQAFGGKLAFAVTSAAPLARDIQTFFTGAGVLLLEAWGLTEMGGALASNTVEQYRAGTVGHVYPQHEVRIAPDGEILARGPCMCKGYHKNHEATAQAFDADGWFHTGDVGTVDAEGFLRIVDRKKDLIITAGGENIAPQLVENTLRAVPSVSQVCVYGDGRPYLVALITLDPASVKEWADTRHIRYGDLKDVYASPEYRAFLDAHVAEANGRLATYEKVRNYDILPDEFTMDHEEVTPVLKIRRQHIHEHYRAQFEALYHRVQTQMRRHPGGERQPAARAR